MSIEQLLLGGHRAYDPTQSAHVTHPLVRCLAIYRTMPLRFGATFALFVVVNGSLTYYQYLLGLAVHDVERGQAAVRAADGSLDLSRALHWAYVLVAIAAARAVLQYVAGIAALSTGQELLYRLRDAILVQVQRLDLGYHLRHGVGEVVARTTRDADKVRDALISFWRNVIETGLVIAASLAILVWYAPILATVPALLIAVGIVMFLRQSDRLVVLDRAVGDAYDKVSQDLVEGVGGVRVIKAFSLEKLRIERFDQSVLAFAAHATSAVRYAASRIPLPQILVALGQVWVFGVGASLVSRGRLNLGELVAAILAMNTLIFRFEGIGRVVQIFADARASAARIMDFLDARPEIVSGKRKLPSGPLGVRLSSVTVSARGGDAPAILENLSLEVASGETVAIVGATGSGKSAMVSLIPRLLDVTAGTVELGGPDVGYVDVRELSLDDLRHHVHVVTQDCFLFSDTLAENVRLAAPGSTDEEVLAALRRAAAADIVNEERGGLGMLIGDRGVTLSGGQRQRVALARALLAKPSVLVLDDSTSALDAVTEQKILHGIRELRSDTTLLLVASKPSTVLFADRIVVLENGRIVAQGSHDDLYRRSATYRELLGMEDGN